MDAAVRLTPADTLVVLLLRIGATLTGAAFFAVLLPVEWMAATHAGLGLGEFPRTAIVDYLARSVAALYGFHGVMLYLISTDVVRYRPLVWFAAAMSAAFGAMLIGIGMHAGLPAYWVAVEGPSVMAIGCVLAWANARAMKMEKSS